MMRSVARRGRIHTHFARVPNAFNGVIVGPTLSLSLNRYNSGQSTVTQENTPSEEKKVESKGQDGFGGIGVYSIPITTHRSYIHCNHAPSLLHKSQLASIPVFTKIENRLVGLATKGWSKMSSSDLKVNKSITRLVKRLLASIPFEEACMRSFPSKSSMIREIDGKVTTERKLATSQLIEKEIKNLEIPPEQINPIPLYHPEFQKPELILKQLHEFRDFSYSRHARLAIICAVGVPVTLPFALLPVVPNVPGLYLAYRLYCHIKVLMGVKHLSYLLETTHPRESTHSGSLEDQELSSTDHLVFKNMPAVDPIYRSFNGDSLVSDPSNSEKLIINDDIIEKVCEVINLPGIKDDLTKAMKQESSRLDKANKA